MKKKLYLIFAFLLFVVGLSAIVLYPESLVVRISGAQFCFAGGMSFILYASKPKKIISEGGDVLPK